MIERVVSIIKFNRLWWEPVPFHLVEHILMYTWPFWVQLVQLYLANTVKMPLNLQPHTCHFIANYMRLNWNLEKSSPNLFFDYNWFIYVLCFALTIIWVICSLWGGNYRYHLILFDNKKKMVYNPFSIREIMDKDPLRH